MDRLKELNGASVPFKFDIHALIFSEDAVSIETTLHQHFKDRAVNKVNTKKEFFYVKPEEVLDALKEHNISVIEFSTDTPAEDYRASWPYGRKMVSATTLEEIEDNKHMNFMSNEIPTMSIPRRMRKDTTRGLTLKEMMSERTK